MTTQQKPIPMLELGLRAYQRAINDWKRYAAAKEPTAAQEALRCAHICQWQLMDALRQRYRIGAG